MIDRVSGSDRTAPGPARLAHRLL